MIDFFLDSYKNAPLWHIFLEFLVFVFGILSVLFAKKENIWVYPTGYILMPFFFIGLLIFPIRGGHAKLKPEKVYDIEI